MIVNPDVVAAYINTKTPRKTQKTTTYWKPKEYSVSKCKL